MADVFAQAIADDLGELGYTNVVIQGAPSRREWHDLPLVLVAPEPRIREWLAFEISGVVSTYSVYFVKGFDGSTLLDPDIDDFQRAMKHFHGLPDALEGAGAWNVKALPKEEVDRSVFGNDYLVSVCRVEVHWIEED